MTTIDLASILDIESFKLAVFAVLLVVYGIALIVASHQDFKHRALTVKMAWVLIGITTAAYVLKAQWIALAAYWIFFGWSFFLYEQRALQIAGGLVYLIGYVLAMHNNWFDQEQAILISMMGVFWVLAFLMPRRGESDFNVLFANMAIFGVQGYLYFVFALFGNYLLMLAAKVISRFQKKPKNFLYILYGLYFELTDPSAKTQPLTANIRKLYPDAPTDTSGETPIPLIPLLMLATMVGMIWYGAATNNVFYQVPGMISILALIFAVMGYREVMKLEKEV